MLRYYTSVDAGASLGASLRELASEAAACSVCAQLATHRRRLTEHESSAKHGKAIDAKRIMVLHVPCTP